MKSRGKLFVTLLCALFIFGMIGTQAFAAPRYKFVFLCHGGEENTFWPPSTTAWSTPRKRSAWTR